MADLVGWLQRLLVGLGVLALAACGGGSGSGADTHPPAASTRIYMLASPTGTLEPGDSPTHWILSLDRPGKDAFWYEDRPRRGSGEQAMSDYVGPDWQRIYGGVNPNATLHFQTTDSADLQGIYANLGQPVWDAGAGRLRVPITVLASSVQGTDEGKPFALHNLFLQVLNNRTGDDDAVFFLQHAAQASIEPTGAGGYRLSLRGVADKTLLAASAPGTEQGSRATADFSATWRERFAGSPPNAAIYGRAGADKVRLFFVTLGVPQYDAAAGMLNYPATMLGDGPASAVELEQVALNIDSSERTEPSSVPCRDFDDEEVMVRAKTISIFNNTGTTIYPVINIGAKDVDQWVQGCLRDAANAYKEPNIYNLFVNAGKGLPAGASVTVTLPLYSTLHGVGEGHHVTWWNGGRVVLANDPEGLSDPGDQPLDVPMGVSCVGRGSDCQLSLIARRTGLPTLIYSQLSEYTFGDFTGAQPPLIPKPYLKPENVGYNISYVDHVYMPVAIGPKNNPYIGYSGSTASLNAFEEALQAFLQGAAGRGWPVYNMRALRLPSGYNIFAERDGLASAGIDVPVKPPGLAAPLLTIQKCVQGGCTDAEQATLRFGQSVQRIQNLWGSCVDWGGEDLSAYVTETVACPADLRQNLSTVKAFFQANYQKYLGLPCSRAASKPDTFGFLQAITHIYGWVPFNSGCGADDNRLADTVIPGWDHGKVQFMYIHDLQYNYLQQAVAANPALLVNPYAKLIHQDLGMSAYAFSVDDAVGFMSELGDGLIFAVGGAQGLENPTQFNYHDGFSVNLGVPQSFQGRLSQPVIKKYGICVIGRDGSDPDCLHFAQDVLMPTNSLIPGFRVGTVGRGGEIGYPLVVRFTDLDDNIYTFRVNRPFAICPSTLPLDQCPTNRSEIVDVASCIVTNRDGVEDPNSRRWCAPVPNQGREASEAQVVKNYINFPVPVRFLQ